MLEVSPPPLSRPAAVRADVATPRFPPGSRGRVAHAVVAILLRIPLQLAILAVVVRIVPRDELFTGSPRALVAIAIATGVGTVITIHGGLLRVGRLTPRAIGWTFDTPARDVVVGLAAFALWLIVQLAWSAAWGADVREMAAEVASFTPGQRLLYLLIGIYAAITEESLFRGYLQPTLVARLRFPAGVLVTALFFALLHHQFDALHMGSKIFGGLLLGLLRGRDSSLIRPAVVHTLQWAILGFA